MRFSTPKVKPEGSVSKEPRVLIYDLELFPILGYAWRRYDTTIFEIVHDKMICSVAWRWQGEKKIHVLGLDDFYGYGWPYKTSKKLVRAFYKEYEKADIVVAHNGDRFDEKHVNTDILLAGLGPPHPHYSVDTLKIFRSKFAFASNRLNDLAIRLGVGKKLAHEGKSMWFKCMAGDKRAWKKMKAYNKMDIEILEGVYKIVGPWDPRHPDLSNFRGDWNCPYCGSSNLASRGFRYNMASVRPRRVCMAKKCGKWSLGPSQRRRKLQKN